MRQTKIMLLLLMVAVPALAFAGTTGPSPVPNPPSFQVSTNTLTLCKGVVNYIPITVSNLGKFNGSITMGSLQLGISSGKSIVAVANGSTNLMTLPPNTSASVRIPVFVNLNTSTLVQAGISVNYNYLNYYSDSEVRNVSFGTMTCPSQLNISISPKVLISGKIENATLVLTNTGSSSLQDISLKVNLPGNTGQVLSVQPVIINSLPPLGSIRVNESMFISSNASQTFPVNLSISMYNGTELEQLSPSIAVLSSGIINMSATGTTVSPTSPAPGSIFSISFVLTDLGTVGASAVTATLEPQSGFTAFGSNSVFIGNMQVDSQTPVTLSLTSLTSLKAGSYIIPIRISYLNNLRQQINSTIDVPVTVAGTGALTANSLRYGSGTATYARRGNGELIVIVILAIAVIALVVLLLRERKRNKKQHEGRK